MGKKSISRRLCDFEVWLSNQIGHSAACFVGYFLGYLVGTLAVLAVALLLL